MANARIRANEAQKNSEPTRPSGHESVRQQAPRTMQQVAPDAAYRRTQVNRIELRPVDFLTLQRAVGNRMVQRATARRMVNADDQQQTAFTEGEPEIAAQTKLTVGAPNDVYEQEADRVAGQVMTMPDAATQRSNQVKPAMQMKDGVPVNDDAGLEQEADVIGARALAIGAVQRSDIPPVQRQLNPDTAEYKPERMPDAELGGLDNFLANNGHTAANYSGAVYTTMTTDYRRVEAADTAIGNANSTNKKRQLRTKLANLYNPLLALANTESLDTNSANWNGAVQAGVETYNALPKADRLNRNQDYEAVAAACWPGRNAAPEAFWTAIRNEARVQFGVGGKDPAEVAVNAIISKANVRFAAFKGNAGLNRGAWAGSNTHGDRPVDYVQTSAKVIAAITARQVRMGGNLGQWWIMNSDTAPTKRALHRQGIDDRGPFIYHL